VHTDNVLGTWWLDGDRALTCGSDGRVVVYDVSKATAATLGAHAKAANRVCAPRNAPAFAYTCSRDLSVAQWKVDESDAKPAREFKGHALNAITGVDCLGARRAGVCSPRRASRLRGVAPDVSRPQGISAGHRGRRR